MGSLESRLNADMIAAMKAGDKQKTSTLRMAIAALKNEKVAGKAAKDLSEADEQAVLTREVHKRKDSAEAYTQGNRPELASKELAEAETLAAYLPAPLTDEELVTLVGEEVANAEASLGAKPTMKQMGQIIKAVTGRAEGRAEGGTVAAKVRAALS
ncbi:GatB/YqeY domain-containing protein [Nigerium massiliense]|uniref:GatB/YqeY domain-containing protein n=1 Tax=Nigerium massiliense TaxID=1522317 RepID=UPI00058E191D|nr:GatB/YqeY domain-containing protein [Nigerium massiliense]